MPAGARVAIIGVREFDDLVVVAGCCGEIKRVIIEEADLRYCNSTFGGQEAILGA